MRDIKFRGKRMDNGEWVYGYYLPDMLEKTHKNMTDWAFIREHQYKNAKAITHEVFKKSVGQSTELTDVNGEEIFEGDIVVFTDGISKNPGKKYICEVNFGCGTYGISCLNGFNVDFGEGNDNFISFWEILWNDSNPDGLYDGSLEWVEVIGNIHDNPELRSVSCAEQGGV